MKSIIETVAEEERFGVLVRALDATGLTEVLDTGVFTLFAPTDSAFAHPKGTAASLAESAGGLRQLVLYHLVSGRLLSGDMVELSSVTSLQGSELRIRGDVNVIMVNDVLVIVADIGAVNGIIHVIDGVLIPS